MNTIYSNIELKQIRKEFKRLWKLLKYGKLIHCSKCHLVYELDDRLCDH